MTRDDDDLPAEAAASQRLARAWFLAAPALVAEYHRIKDRLEREGQWEYVGDVRDSEELALSEFDSHSQQLLHEQQAVLTQIDEVLISDLRRGLLTAWAREGSPLGSWRTIPRSAWQNLKLQDVRVGTATAPGVMLFDIRIGVPIVASEPDPVPAPRLPKYARAGRPSNMRLVEAEFERRAEAGELEVSLVRETVTLAGWFKLAHPDSKPLAAKTIEAHIRKDYWSYRSNQR